MKQQLQTKENKSEKAVRFNNEYEGNNKQKNYFGVISTDKR